LRRLAKSEPAQHLIQTWRGARAVRETGRFARRQFAGRRVGAYTLRGSGQRVHLRHGARDVAVFNEIYGGTAGRNCYEPPAPVARILDAQRDLSVLDVGANIGLFSLFALTRWPGSRVLALEPDPGNFALLSETVAANVAAERLRIEQVAAFNAPGTLPFAAGLFSDAHVADPDEPGTIEVPGVDFFAHDPGAGLIKMDIEGGEWPILTDPRLGSLRARAIVLEWHRRGCPGDEPRALAVELLAAAGYAHVLDVEDHGESGVFWCWR
jgi:FkbM family methyltransferase